MSYETSYGDNFGYGSTPAAAIPDLGRPFTPTTLATGLPSINPEALALMRAGALPIPQEPENPTPAEDFSTPISVSQYFDLIHLDQSQPIVFENASALNTPLRVIATKLKRTIGGNLSDELRSDALLTKETLRIYDRAVILQQSMSDTVMSKRIEQALARPLSVEYPNTFAGDYELITETTVRVLQAIRQSLYDTGEENAQQNALQIAQHLLDLQDDDVNSSHVQEAVNALTEAIGNTRMDNRSALLTKLSSYDSVFNPTPDAPTPPPPTTPEPLPTPADAQPSPEQVKATLERLQTEVSDLSRRVHLSSIDLVAQQEDTQAQDDIKLSLVTLSILHAVTQSIGELTPEALPDKFGIAEIRILVNGLDRNRQMHVDVKEPARSYLVDTYFAQKLMRMYESTVVANTQLSQRILEMYNSQSADNGFQEALSAVLALKTADNETITTKDLLRATGIDLGLKDALRHRLAGFDNAPAAPVPPTLPTAPEQPRAETTQRPTSLLLFDAAGQPELFAVETVDEAGDPVSRSRLADYYQMIKSDIPLRTRLRASYPLNEAVRLSVAQLEAEWVNTPLFKEQQGELGDIINTFEQDSNEAAALFPEGNNIGNDLRITPEVFTLARHIQQLTGTYFQDKPFPITQGDLEEARKLFPATEDASAQVKRYAGHGAYLVALVRLAPRLMDKDGAGQALGKGNIAHLLVTIHTLGKKAYGITPKVQADGIAPSQKIVERMVEDAGAFASTLQEYDNEVKGTSVARRTIPEPVLSTPLATGTLPPQASAYVIPVPPEIVTGLGVQTTPPTPASDERRASGESTTL